MPFALSAEHDGYLLQRSSEEMQRLVMQAKVWESATRRALSLVRLQPGHKVLDAGCGPGETMRLIAERIGESGRVTGLDADPGIGAPALARLHEYGLGCGRFVAGDVMQTEALGGGPYDLVFARLLVFHLPDPQEALRRLWRWVKPGGALLIMDYDCSVSRSLTHGDAFERAISLAVRALEAGGRTIDIGTRMPLLFLESGIGRADGTEITGMLQPAAPSATMLRSLVSSLRPAILGARLADEAALEHLDREMAAEGERTDAYGRWPDMVATWKRKPA